MTDNEVKQRVASNVQSLLVRRGMSQKLLAQKTGETPTRINDVVRGNHVPSIGVITRIAEALDTTVDWLLMTETPMSQNNSEMVA